jgi:hypothetical protein
MDEVEWIIKIVERVGYPIAVSLYFMIRLDKRTDRIIGLLEAIGKNQGICATRGNNGSNTGNSDSGGSRNN